MLGNCDVALQLAAFQVWLIYTVNFDVKRKYKLELEDL
jgi:hypothetical protein